MNLAEQFNNRVISVWLFVMMSVLLVSYTLSFVFIITPQWNFRNQLALNHQLTNQGQIEMARATPTTQTSPTRDQTLEFQIDQVQTTLSQFRSIFLQESQVQEILNRLYQHASASQVEISALQSKPVPNNDAREIYDVFLFQMEAVGELPRLLDFISRLEETSAKSLVLTNLIIEGGEDEDKLTADFFFYSSPDADGSAVTLAPINPESTPTPQSEYDILVNQLHGLWSREDWLEVINALERILEIDPGNEEMLEKLVSAYINWGYRLISEDKAEIARENFEKALLIGPGNDAALAGLQSITILPTPTPEVTVYIVIRGDTIYSLSKRFGTTIDAIKEVNGLNSNAIFVGQVLNIPPGTDP